MYDQALPTASRVCLAITGLSMRRNTQSVDIGCMQLDYRDRAKSHLLLSRIAKQDEVTHAISGFLCADTIVSDLVYCLYYYKMRQTKPSGSFIEKLKPRHFGRGVLY